MASIEVTDTHQDEKEDQDPPSRKRLKIDTPNVSRPMSPRSESLTTSPKPLTPPPPSFRGRASDPSIENHFNYHLGNLNMYVSPEDKKNPKMVPDIHVSVTKAVKALKGISRKAQEFFEEEYLIDIYVWINSLDEMRDFATIALQYPKISGRIKLDSRNVYEKEKPTKGTISVKEQVRREEKTKALETWKEQIAKILDLIRGEYPLTKDGFKVFLCTVPNILYLLNQYQDLVLTKEALPLTRAEQARLDEAKASNPRGKHISNIADDLKTLKHRDKWSIVLSCDSVLLDEKQQKFQVWGEIGRLGRLWKYYAPGAEADGVGDASGSESGGGEEHTNAKLKINNTQQF